MTTRARQQRIGFTLVEVAILLVVIGLLVGGVMAGKNMLEASRIRATLSQVEQFNASTAAFEVKYGGLPGDLLATRAAKYGLFTMTGATHSGDGNGIIQGTDANGDPYGCLVLNPTTGSFIVGEPLAFWRHLWDAKLIDKSYGSDLDTSGGLATANPVLYLPVSKLGKAMYFMPCSYRSGISPISASTARMYYLMIGLTADFSNHSIALSPITAYTIDSKVDDGLPYTGTIIVATSDVEGDGSSIYEEYRSTTAGVSVCLLGSPGVWDASVTYNTGAGGNSQACYGLQFAFQ